jgi:hypothetical protein
MPFSTARPAAPSSAPTSASCCAKFSSAIRASCSLRRSSPSHRAGAQALLATQPLLLGLLQHALGFVERFPRVRQRTLAR